MTTMHEGLPDDGRDTPDRAARDHTWSEDMTGLRARWNELLGAMEDARTAGIESWPEVRADLTRAFGETQHALEAAVRRFRELRRARADQRDPAAPILADGPSDGGAAMLEAGPSTAQVAGPADAGDAKLRTAVDPEC